ncbi:ADP-ribosylglycohydrolase family protein [Flavobacterium sp.]|uniref:ADP-ribosylglycohydrolase family protein n=1 Tax=Flavobacterium sp. TaxID=239 RepID=UPI0022BB043C|nr:ADP-ribosylglycohydrolase family protein [Flavobacterium sp.]MCZ8089365.1 ADP-ribosylglycohydrolase family protein [Flavobacterium sp.]
MKTSSVHSALFGLAIGDALGVPVEFRERDLLKKDPVVDLREYGTHHQPKGTWSDDSSLTFCLADSLCNGYDLNEIAHYILLWYQSKMWTPHGSVFDIGITTRNAIYRISKGETPVLCGGYEESENGNGSLMRILPLAFYLKNETDKEIIFEKVKEVSSITHSHFRSVFSCFIYIIFAIELLGKKDKKEAYSNTKKIINSFIESRDFNLKEINLFDRLLRGNINELHEDNIYSSGYVLHTLEASMWCILNSNSYEETVLKAVNLGEDTDTTAAISGGLAGIIYEYNSIPKEWIKNLARNEAIENLCNKLSNKYEI